MRDLSPSELLHLVACAIAYVQQGRRAMVKDTCQVSTRDLSDIGEDLKVYPGVVHDTQEGMLTGGRILQKVEVEAS